MALNKTEMKTLVTKIQKILNLERWTIILKIMDDGEYKSSHGKDFSHDSNGCTAINNKDYVANIYLKSSLTKDLAIDTIIHECIHLVTNPYDSFVQDTIEYSCPKKVRVQLYKEALWKMECHVMQWTNIIRRLI